jgi:hypothetical protein
VRGLSALSQKELADKTCKISWPDLKKNLKKNMSVHAKASRRANNAITCTKQSEKSINKINAQHKLEWNIYFDVHLLTQFNILFTK